MYFTQCSRYTAVKCLMLNDWEFDKAVDKYFQIPGAYPSDAALDVIEALYRVHADPEDPTKISGNRLVYLLEHLHLPFDSVLVLILAWKCEARIQCEFTDIEFFTGLAALKIKRIDCIKERLIECEKYLNEHPDEMEQLYRYCFNYAREPQSINLPLSTAAIYWNMILRNKFKHLDLFVYYLKQTKVKVINRDLWNMLWIFAQTIDDEMTNYDMYDAWPTLLDEFVQWYRDRKTLSLTLLNDPADIEMD